MLEDIRRWKRLLKANIRRSLRAQFTSPPSAHFKSLFPPEKEPVTSAATQFAEAPLLNPEQLTLAFTRPVSKKPRWVQQTVSVPVKEKGIYLVEAVNKDLRAYTLLMVSDLVLISKTGDGRIVNFLVDRASGQPVPNATVTAFTKDGATAHAETDRDGIAELKTAVPSDSTMTVMAKAGGDITVNALDGRESAGEWSGYVYTDRPVYRPGHTVHFRALLRVHAGTGYVNPAGRKVSVTIQDAEQKPIYQKSLVIGANGSIHDDLVLGPAAPLGDYMVEVKSGNEMYGYMSGNFEVQDYKKPEYEVRVTPAKVRILQGETVQAVIDAQYFFGEPVSGAKVKYKVYREPYWFPLWYDADDEADASQGEYGGDGGDQNDNDGGGDQLTDQQGQLDAQGKLTITIPTAVSAHKNDFHYRVEVGVTDAANRRDHRHRGIRRHLWKLRFERSSGPLRLLAGSAGHIHSSGAGLRQQSGSNARACGIAALEPPRRAADEHRRDGYGSGRERVGQSESDNSRAGRIVYGSGDSANAGGQGRGSHDVRVDLRRRVGDG